MRACKSDPKGGGIPTRREIDAQIQVFIDELFLGPVTLELTGSAPQGYGSPACFRDRKKPAYIDLSLRMLDTDEELPFTFDEALENMRF